MKKTLFQKTAGKWIIFILTVLVCVSLAALFLQSKPKEQAEHTDNNTKDSALSGMPVSIVSIHPSSYPALITALGEVKPLWQSAIKAKVDGAVLNVSDRLQPGNLVKKDELLLEIDSTSFDARLSETESQEAEAKLALLKEERESREAQANWHRSGIKGAPADLALRKPQLDAARAAVQAAQDAVTNARKQRSYTKIRAPFDGIIMERHVNPGETLFAGDAVFTLFSVQTAEIWVHVANEQWQLLGANKAQVQVRVVSPETGASWQARLVRDAQRLNPQSRLRTLYLQVDNPLEQTPPLLTGTFVRAEITGLDIPNLLCIPETALTRQGFVWFVQADNRLHSIQAQPVFYGEGVVYIRNPGESETYSVAVSPNASFTNGLSVQPQPHEKKNAEQASTTSAAN
ncbi:efflux RND transporter periplasmic adaptor subunit [Desulfogranum japonicum]|uniref:efflux RND transporter periplasmic adaptor subunit n=1 Tax=Desulfogranum japonicum TaxID=231447 RepID=UPI00041A852C|nr:efflux RND transporter periplasmic adaptor subunit [Desulfogranum japonicum]